MATLRDRRTVETVSFGFDAEGEPDFVETSNNSRRSIIPSRLGATFERRSVMNTATGVESRGDWQLTSVTITGYPRLKSGEPGKVLATEQFYGLRNTPEWARAAIREQQPANEEDQR